MKKLGKKARSKACVSESSWAACSRNSIRAPSPAVFRTQLASVNIGENQLASRSRTACDAPQSRDICLTGEVLRNAQPGEERRFRRAETRARQGCAKLLLSQVGGHEAEVSRHLYSAVPKSLPLEVLSSRVVHLEDRHVAGKDRLT